MDVWDAGLPGPWWWHGCRGVGERGRVVIGEVAASVAGSGDGLCGWRGAW